MTLPTDKNIRKALELAESPSTVDEIKGNPNFFRHFIAHARTLDELDEAKAELARLTALPEQTAEDAAPDRNPTGE